MKTLYVIASPRAERSKSIELWNHAAKALWWEIVTLDIYNSDLPFLSEWVIGYNYWFSKYEDLSDSDKKISDVQKKYIDQIKNVDNIVIATPMWNFWLPASLKAWFDLVLKVNDTFSMENGNYLWLVKNIDKTIVVWARGWKYINTPYAAYDNLTGPINWLLWFIWLEPKNFWLEWTNMISSEELTLEIANLKDQINSYLN